MINSYATNIDPTGGAPGDEPRTSGRRARFTAVVAAVALSVGAAVGITASAQADEPVCETVPLQAGDRPAGGGTITVCGRADGATTTTSFTIDFADSDPGRYTRCVVSPGAIDTARADSAYMRISWAAYRTFDCLDAARTNGTLQGFAVGPDSASGPLRAGALVDNSALIVGDYDGRMFRREVTVQTGPYQGDDRDVTRGGRPVAPDPDPPPAQPGPASTGSDGVLRIPLVNGLVFSKAGAYEEVRDTSNRVHNWTFDGTTDVQEIHDGTLRVVWRIDRATGTGDKTVIENGAVVSSVPATASDAPVWQGAAATGIPDRR